MFLFLIIKVHVLTCSNQWYWNQIHKELELFITVLTQNPLSLLVWIALGFLLHFLSVCIYLEGKDIHHKNQSHRLRFQIYLQQGESK